MPHWAGKVKKIQLSQPGSRQNPGKSEPAPSHSGIGKRMCRNSRKTISLSSRRRFFPHVATHDNEMQINYTRRLRRPWGGQLNSFHDISDPTNISYGNPELQPQYSNALN